jgi:hypothetical protein
MTDAWPSAVPNRLGVVPEGVDGAGIGHETDVSSALDFTARVCLQFSLYPSGPRSPPPYRSTTWLLLLPTTCP